MEWAKNMQETSVHRTGGRKEALVVGSVQGQSSAEERREGVQTGVQVVGLPMMTFAIQGLHALPKKRYAEATCRRRAKVGGRVVCVTAAQALTGPCK